MKVKPFLLYFGLFALLFCSCELQIENGGGSGGIDVPVNGPSRKFWAQNLQNDSFYQVDAELLAESKNCRVWAEKKAGISVATAIAMANAYEEDILPKMLNTFAYVGPIGYRGNEVGPIGSIKNGTVIANNTMELAGWMTGGDGKLTILLLDIVDSFKPRENDVYCAGYFWPVNLYENDPSQKFLKYSNECSMIYIDTYPGVPGTEESSATFAHELQHLMCFVNHFISGKQSYIDTWIDEGLSSAAEWLYLGGHVASKINWYNGDLSGLIRKGNNFFVWDNRGSENTNAVLDDYATVYLFFQWLRLQSGSTRIYNDITMSSDYDYKAITNAANKAMSGNGYDDWGTLLKTWLAANYINAPSGPYGYRNDSTLKNISVKTFSAGNTNVSLAPGEGVFSMTNNYVMPSGKQNIRYAGLDKTGVLSNTETYSGGVLLTYNANTNNTGGTESGTTTGIASYDAADIDASARSVAGINLSGPFAIGAQDILRRNGFEKQPFFVLTGLKGIIELE